MTIFRDRCKSIYRHIEQRSSFCDSFEELLLTCNKLHTPEWKQTLKKKNKRGWKDQSIENNERDR